MVVTKRKKGGQATRIQQQQEAAAKRRRVGAGTGSRQQEAPRVEKIRETRHYLDVSVVRIQEWLARTPDLRFRRGGSSLLAEMTADYDWGAVLPPEVSLNTEAGTVDGVVSLVSADDGPLAATARDVVARIRQRVPYCHLQAVSGTGDSYAGAYPQMARKRQDGDLLVDSPPVPQEVIVAKPCQQCRQAAATHRGVTILEDEDRPDLCEDCYQRFLAAGRNSGARRVIPLPERRMRKALGIEDAEFAGKFADLAEAGQTSKDDASTQIALIYADGNKVGAFLGALAENAGRPGVPGKSEIAKMIDEATVGALADAIVSRFAGWSPIPVLANLAGGDDLLVSVPAADAWLFAHTLLAAFSDRLGKNSVRWPDVIRRTVPTLSAGMVFCYAKAPFSDVLRLATGRLKDAKERFRGEEAAISFLDLTADGGQPPPDRQPVTLGYLNKHSGGLGRIAGLPGSRRETLLALYRQGRTEDFIQRVTDLDNDPMWELIVKPGATVQEARDALADPGKRSELRNALDIARHWRTQPREEVTA
jgi:hypothetical protein